MKKFLSIAILVLFGQLQIGGAFADSDGKLEIGKKGNNNAEVKDCFETINRGVFAFNQA